MTEEEVACTRYGQFCDYLDAHKISQGTHKQKQGRITDMADILGLPNK